MYKHIADIGRDLNLANANDGSDTDRIQVECKSFSTALKVARQVVKYLKANGYKEGKLDGGNQRQGADYADEDNNQFNVSIRWNNEVHIMQY